MYLFSRYVNFTGHLPALKRLFMHLYAGGHAADSLPRWY
jgi:hypothetical protein